MADSPHPEDPEYLRERLKEQVAKLRQASYNIDMYPSSAHCNCEDIDEVADYLESLL